MSCRVAEHARLRPPIEIEARTERRIAALRVGLPAHSTCMHQDGRLSRQDHRQQSGRRWRLACRRINVASAFAVGLTYRNPARSWFPKAAPKGTVKESRASVMLSLQRA